MREIKFRAWLKNEKKMVDVRCVNTELELVEFRDEEDDIIWCQTFRAIELMQFTGLYDKNGTPIYEGDIVHLTQLDNYGCVKKEYVGEVIFRNETYRFLVTNGKSTDYNWWYYGEKEVIGNIYENADLLEVEE